ncbi:hypothetical protein G1C96_0309 [Bifidobacterium sp. DSM 109958]|uniref:Uncharacterized protein n=2 Tax=Bifidobacterium moraviense TaxID=2675323 RepID=A0A7Y0F266_9BIFI|nr:hypothetical protein [Bifidobacterium sp. DSM 109958]
MVVETAKLASDIATWHDGRDRPRKRRTETRILSLSGCLGPTIIPQTIMNDKLQGIFGLAFGLIAAACAFTGFAPWITALFAIAAGVDCLTLGLFGGRQD